MAQTKINPKQLRGGVPARSLRLSMPRRSSGPVEITTVATAAPLGPVRRLPPGKRAILRGMGA